MNEIKICTAGDSSLLIEFGQEISPEINAQITALVHMIRAQHIEGVTDMIPAFASLLINYDPRVVSYAGLRARLEKLLKLEISGEASESRIFEIPVCYGGEYGPDLQNIADHAGLTPEEAALMAKVSRSMIVNWYQREEFPIIHIGNRVRICRKEFEAWLKERRKKNGVHTGTKPQV